MPETLCGTNVEQERIPLLAREGWTRHQEDDAEGHQSWRGRGVQSLKHLISKDHPVCAFKVASQHFLDGAATPPVPGGESVSLPARREPRHNALRPSPLGRYVRFSPVCRL